MITIRIHKEADYIKEISIKGHSNYAPKGEDIVCAGVSAIGVGTINALNEITKTKPIYKVEEGDLLVKFNDDEKTQVIAQTMMVQLKSIEETYKKFVKILYI